jgi:hypothetical protein
MSETSERRNELFVITCDGQSAADNLARVCRLLSLSPSSRSLPIATRYFSARVSLCEYLPEANVGQMLPCGAIIVLAPEVGVEGGKSAWERTAPHVPDDCVRLFIVDEALGPAAKVDALLEWSVEHKIELLCAEVLDGGGRLSRRLLEALECGVWRHVRAEPAVAAAEGDTLDALKYRSTAGAGGDKGDDPGPVSSLAGLAGNRIRKPLGVAFLESTLDALVSIDEEEGSSADGDGSD